MSFSVGNFRPMRFFLWVAHGLPTSQLPIGLKFKEAHGLKKLHRLTTKSIYFNVRFIPLHYKNFGVQVVAILFFYISLCDNLTHPLSLKWVVSKFELQLFNAITLCMARGPMGNRPDPWVIAATTVSAWNPWASRTYQTSRQAKQSKAASPRAIICETFHILSRLRDSVSSIRVERGAVTCIARISPYVTARAMAVQKGKSGWERLSRSIYLMESLLQNCRRVGDLSASPVSCNAISS